MLPGTLYAEYVEDLLAGRRRACRAAVEALLATGTPVRTLFLELFTDSLREVGRRWEAGQASVAQEHLATAITEELLALVFPAALAAAPPAEARRTALVACAVNEYHQIGGRIVADTLELAGWDTAFLGANTPVEDLVTLARGRRFDAIFLSVAVLENLPRAMEVAAALRVAAPGSVIVLGGGAFLQPGAAAFRLPPEVRLLPDLAALDAALPTLIA